VNYNQHPVNNVVWVDANCVQANDYNPNTVAPPEMKLLELSILEDGITQPVVVYKESASLYIVVDGFHRATVIKNNKKVRESTGGKIPIVIIEKPLENRMASTIRHNRARGKHGVEPMSDIVESLTQKGWDDAKIAKELGMDAEEVLRMKQVKGLNIMFSNRSFSEAWE
jgi:ParB-like chromosome segregation protein Spo0J